MESYTCTCGYGISCSFCTCDAKPGFNSLEISFILPLLDILKELVERNISILIGMYLFSDISNIFKISNERFTSLFNMRVFNIPDPVNLEVFQIIKTDFPRVFIDNNWIDKIKSNLIFQRIFVKFFNRIFSENYYQQGLHAILHYLFEKHVLFSKNDIFVESQDFEKILLELDRLLSNFYKFFSLKDSNPLLKRVAGEDISIYLLKLMTCEDDFYGHREKIMCFLYKKASNESFKELIQYLKSTSIRRMDWDDMNSVFNPYLEIKGVREKKGILIPSLNRENLSNKEFLNFLLDKLEKNHFNPSYKIRIGWKINNPLIEELVKHLNNNTKGLFIELERRSFLRSWDSWALLIARKKQSR